MTRILIAEDEPRIASFLEKGLRANGFTTSVAESGTEAASMARHGEFDLLILDLGLPRMDGSQVLREMRERNDRLPVIILTARDGIDDTVAGLEGRRERLHDQAVPVRGAAGTNPVQLRKGGEPAPTVVSAGGITLDLRKRRARVGERTVELTAREFALMETLLRHPGRY